jgi:hypothetical protein
MKCIYRKLTQSAIIMQSNDVTIRKAIVGYRLVKPDVVK